jgi:hypothetical protein
VLIAKNFASSVVKDFEDKAIKDKKINHKEHKECTKATKGMLSKTNQPIKTPRKERP